MDILVLSDSHGRREKIEEAINRQIKKPDAIIFLGDGLRDIVYAEIGNIPIYRVSGNCDMGGFFSDNGEVSERVAELCGKRIFMTHGHKYGVKSTFTPLLNEATSREADIVLFGHTHEKCEGMIDNENELGIRIKKPLYIMNPGSIGSYPYDFGVISIDRGGRVLLSHGSLA